MPRCQCVVTKQPICDRSRVRQGTDQNTPTLIKRWKATSGISSRGRVKWKIFGNVFYKLDHPHVLFYLQSLLGVISKDDGITNIYFSAIWWFQALYHINEC